MSGLAHYLEDEGIPTVVVALVREHAEKVRPPRALWVPYPLGRPFGPPNDPTVQTRVLRQALELLQAPSGPVLVDAIDPADNVVEDMSWVCPVSFASAPVEDADLGARVNAEMAQLRPWYDLGRERRGRTTVGLASIPVDASADLLAGYVDNQVLSAADETSAADALRWSAGDLKSYYLEAATAQPGTDPAAQLESWFWGETAAGELLKQLREVCLAHDDPGVRDVGDFMLMSEEYH